MPETQDSTNVGTIDAKAENAKGSEAAKTPPTPEEKDKPAEETVPKKLLDEKISEMERINKQLKEQLSARMTEDEKKDAAKEELAAARRELETLRAETSLLSAGLDPEGAKKIAACIAESDPQKTVSAIVDLISKVKDDTTKGVKQELLKTGSPDVNVGGKTEQPDINLELMKKLVSAKKTKSLKDSKWLN